jgi:hypothetical protein
MERMVEPTYQRVMQRTVMVHYQVHCLAKHVGAIV